MKSILNLAFLLVICVFSLRSVAGSILNGTLTVSGLSSGAFMAVQMHVSYSSQIDGAGVVAGGVYYAAQGNVLTALALMTNPNMVAYDTIVNMQIPALEMSGVIDQSANLAHTRAYLFSGTLDTVVHQGNMQLLSQFYTRYGVKHAAEFSLPTEHTFPTAGYGNPCGNLGSPYISNCKFDTAYNMLSNLYGYPLKAPVKYDEANLLIVDQRTFVPPVYQFISAAAGINNRAYIYVPSGCKAVITSGALDKHLFVSDSSTDYEAIRREHWETSFLKANVNNSARDRDGQSPLGSLAKCRVHIALHGCEQSLQQIGEEFVRKTGYLEYAEANDIIVAFPQAQQVLGTNPKSCWNWWGYFEPLAYHTKFSAQPMTVMNLATTLVTNVRKYVK